MMKILFVTEHNPFSKSFGAEQRSNVFLHAMLSNGYHVDVAYVGYDDDLKEDVSVPEGCKVAYWNRTPRRIRSVSSRIIHKLTLDLYPSDRSLKNVINAIIEQGDYTFIFCRYIHVAETVGLERYASRLLLDIDDLPTQKLVIDDSLPWLTRVRRTLLRLRLLSLQRRWVDRSYQTYLPNKSQADSYGSVYWPNISLNSVNSVNFIPHCNDVLFVANLSYLPNVAGIDVFLRNIMPLVLKRVPDMRIRIAGKGLPEEYHSSWKKLPNVEILGFVDDITEFYSSANIVVCPVYSGAGTNIKAIEAMAMGKAVVMTRFCTKGFESVAIDGKTVMVSDSDADFAEKLSYLLETPTACSSIAENALAAAKSVCSQAYLNDLFLSSIQK